MSESDIQNIILPCYSNIINNDSHLDESIPEIIKSIKNNIFKDYEKEHGIKNIELNINLNKKNFDNGKDFIHYLSINNDNESVYIKNILLEKKILNYDNLEIKNYIYDIIYTIDKSINIEYNLNYLNIKIIDKNLLEWKISDNLLEIVFDYEPNICIKMYFYPNSFYKIKEVANINLQNFNLNKNIRDKYEITNSLKKEFKENIDIVNPFNLLFIIITSNCQFLIESYVIKNSNLFLFEFLDLKFKNIIFKLKSNFNNTQSNYKADYFLNFDSINKFNIDIYINNKNIINAIFEVDLKVNLPNKKNYKIIIENELMLYFLKKCSKINFTQDIYIGCLLEFDNDIIKYKNNIIGNISLLEKDLLNFLIKYDIKDNPTYLDNLIPDISNLTIKNNNFFLKNFDLKYNIFNKPYLKILFNKNLIQPANYIIAKIIQEEIISIYNYNYTIIENINTSDIINLIIQKIYIGKKESADIFKYNILLKNKIIGILEITSEPQIQLHLFPDKHLLSIQKMIDIYNKFYIAKKIITSIDKFLIKNYDISIIYLLNNNPKNFKIIQKTQLIVSNYKNLISKNIFLLKSDDGLVNSNIFENMFTFIFQYILFKLYKNNNIISKKSYYWGYNIGFISAFYCNFDNLDICKFIEFIFLKDLMLYLKINNKDILDKKFNILIKNNIFDDPCINNLININNKDYNIIKELFINFTDSKKYDFDKHINKINYIYEYSKEKLISNIINNNNIEVKLYDI